MRMTRTTRSAAVLSLALALATTACGQGSGGSASSGGSTGGAASGSAGGGGGGEGATVAFVPKLQGIPYFEAMNTGGAAACEEIGCTWLYQGPVEADPAAQADIVRSFIQQGVDALIVAPNDPDSMAPLLKQAADAGIKVATADTDAPNSVREVFVSQASTEGIGEALTDAVLGAMGGKGKYAIVSCGQTAQNLNSWIEVQKAYTAEKYPDAEIVDIVYAGEDQAQATQMATDLMNAHPDLTGLVGECTSSAPGVAQAVQDAGKTGQVFTVGLGTPQSMAPYLTEGSSSASILWDVENLGHLTAWAGVQLAAGEEFQASNDVSSDITGVTFDPATKVLLLGPPLTITKDNAGDYDY
ncbi:autoinducer 2 ABC transporter substrate-binding protein [Modestobacter sp. VKM Ac-2986]|uniref:autoinducer 2 ABC transporter substrate-binding protein n=1 Tax=Modestobacter sp. VKM Ac-2986 TaxID=3004140 RepID=UPI0022AB8D1F|nr:autoinducer 2 ABC transporter substrate-binding protein [Modestobacter sp. VKM Ac-2986]MCZ2830847.1 autoinducer 2 ABC transporter substrate-binding protein [Modestobacter sp. VKM Ac-2986]